MAVPAAPKLRAFVLSKGKVKLTWKAVDGATSYNLYQSLTRTDASGRNEKQTITIDAAGGTFRVTFDGQQTAPVAWNATAAVLEAALIALSNIGANDVDVTKAGSVFTVEFTGLLARTNVATMTTDATSLTGGAGTAVVATSQTPVVVNDDDVDAPLIDTLAVGTRGVYVLRAANAEGESEPSNVVSLANRDY